MFQKKSGGLLAFGCTFLLLVCLCAVNCKSQRSFKIDPGRKTFLKDGEPFRYISGSLHYFRIPHQYWGDRMKKVRSAGFNAIQVYVEWNSHEPEFGVYDFKGQNDLEHFMKLADHHGLLVLLRPGPFIDAERDMGGLPFWLLEKHPDIKLRTADPNFLKYVDKWYTELFTQLKKHLYANGGPIVMVQSENEYGSYALQTQRVDTEYLVHMRDLVRGLVGPDTLIYSTDGSATEDVRGSYTPGVFSTVDFGATQEVEECFRVQRLFEPNGPLVNSEFYPGWLDHWGRPHEKRPTNQIVNTFDKMLSMGANVNVYLIHGGTSFGFGAGANSPPYEPCPTSYDYDAPISEAGDLTPKYFAMKETIRKYLPIPNIPVNASSPKGAYGRVSLQPAASLIGDDEVAGLLSRGGSKTSKWPETFEALGQAFGLVLYENEAIAELYSDPAELDIPGLRDRGYVFVDGELRGILSRIGGIFKMPLSIRPGQKLQIMVENQGRICFGPDINDFKGILGNVTLNKHPLQQWKMTGYPLNDKALMEYGLSFGHHRLQNSEEWRQLIIRNKGSMTFWIGSFKTPCGEAQAKDSFLKFKNWRKGVAFLNGINLGRYWPVMGPQITLYVPGAWIKPKCQLNTLVIFEQDNSPCVQDASKCYVEFVTEPEIDGPTPIMPTP